MKAKRFAALALLTVAALIISACAAPGGTASSGAAGQTSSAGASSGAEDYTTPHAILSDLHVRQAIAHCIDRDALIASVYPYVEDKTALQMDTFIPKTHWAYGGNITDYAYDPDAGMKLLDEAGWNVPEGATAGDGSVRVNANGDSLSLKLTTTTAQFRQTWTAVAVQNL